MTDKAAPSARLLIAEIGAAHGIRGLVKLRAYCDDLDLLDNQELFTHDTKPHTLKIKLERVTDNLILARVGNTQDRTAAEKLRGTKFYIDQDTLPDIEESGVYYHRDLIDLTAQDMNKKTIGTIQNVVNFGASDLLDIKPATGPNFYLPFTDDFVPHVDIDTGHVTITGYEAFLPEPKKEKKVICRPGEGRDDTKKDDTKTNKKS